MFPFSTPIRASHALEVAPGQSIPEFFESTGFEEVCRNLLELSDTDRQRQVSYIRAAFHCPLPTASSPVSNADVLLPATDDMLIEDALQIAGRIREAAILGDADGTAAWLTMAYHADANCLQMSPPPFVCMTVCGEPSLPSGAPRQSPHQDLPLKPERSIIRRDLGRNWPVKDPFATCATLRVDCIIGRHGLLTPHRVCASGRGYGRPQPSARRSAPP
jgi:hypothetical protein